MQKDTNLTDEAASQGKLTGKDQRKDFIQVRRSLDDTLSAPKKSEQKSRRHTFSVHRDPIARVLEETRLEKMDPDGEIGFITCAIEKDKAEHRRRRSFEMEKKIKQDLVLLGKVNSSGERVRFSDQIVSRRPLPVLPSDKSLEEKMEFLRRSTQKPGSFSSEKEEIKRAEPL